MEILLENLDKGYLVVKVCGEDKFDTLTQMGNLMIEKGFVKDTYTDAVKAREVVFPTGLPMEAFGVAIPHTDSIHVNKKAIMCGIFEKPNDFVMMATDDEIVSCEMAFMLAIISPDDQIEMLGKLIENCQDVEMLNTIKKAEDLDAINGIMEKLMA